MKTRIALVLLCLWSALAPAASLLSVSKTPFEAFNCSVDFTAVAAADGINLIGVVATNLQTGADWSGVVIATSPAPAVVGTTDVVVFRVQGGTNAQTFIVGARVADKVTGEIFEGQITLTINSATGR